MRTKPYIRYFIPLMLLLIAAFLSCDGNIYNKLKFKVYTLTYDGNGSTGGSVPAAPRTYNKGDLITIPDNTGLLERSDCGFAGWNTSPDGSGTAYEAGSQLTMPGTDLTIYAIWSVEVVFDSRGGSPVGEEYSPQSLFVGQKVKEPEDPAYGEYEFDGWYSDYERTIKWNFDDAVEKSMTLNAQWTGGDTCEDRTSEMRMSSARYGHAAAVVNNKIYVIGGYEDGTISNTVEEFDPATAIWRTMAVLPSPARAYHRAVAVGSNIYVIGGMDSANVPLIDVEIFDPVGNSWTSGGGPSLSVARYHFGAAEIGHNTIYVYGGTGDGISALGGGELLSIGASSWQTFTGPGENRMALPCTSFGGALYFPGGYNGSSFEAYGFRYNVEDNVWSNILAVPGNMLYHEAVTFATNERIYAFGGSNIYQVFSDKIYEYNPYTNTWNSMNAVLSAPKAGFSASLVNNKIYILGGRTETSVNGVDTVEIYTPPTP